MWPNVEKNWGSRKLRHVTGGKYVISQWNMNFPTSLLFYLLSHGSPATDSWREQSFGPNIFSNGNKSRLTLNSRLIRFWPECVNMGAGPPLPPGGVGVRSRGLVRSSLWDCSTAHERGRAFFFLLFSRLLAPHWRSSCHLWLCGLWARMWFRTSTSSRVFPETVTHEDGTRCIPIWGFHI